MELKALRDEIDSIDDQLATLFARRMDAVKRVAEVKSRGGIAVAHPDRERDIILRTTALVPEEVADYTQTLMTTLFELSRAYQRQLLKDNESNPTAKEELQP